MHMLSLQSAKISNQLSYMLYVNSCADKSSNVAEYMYGWADTTCLMSLIMYLMPTTLFSYIIMSPNHAYRCL